MDIYQLKITLLNIEPKIYRIVQVPSAITLRNLHKVIQKVMAWENCHLYQFVKGHVSYAPQSTEFSFSQGLSDRSVPLCDLLLKARNKLIYEYDFGDGWLHEVLLQKIIPAEEGVRYPVCIEGKFAAPPEDSGGPPGYCDLLEALGDPAHEGHEDAVSWLGDDFDPELFDLEQVNRQLRRIKV
ncbi:MAG TPA: plasmid pRiA4b ORF-3 family protein [Geobacteraceae bacterium]